MAPPPLEWDLLCGYFAARAIPGVESVDGGVYRRTIEVDGEPAVVELSPSLSARWPEAVHRRVRRLLALDLDVEAATSALAGDPVLGPLVARRPGLRPPGAWDPFEVGVRAIIGQQVSVTGATTLIGRLVRRHGTEVGALPAGLTHTFPHADELADADLDGVGLTRGRATAVRAYAGALASGTVRVDGTVPLDELVASIAALRGLGPWTAHYIALRVGQPDAFPAGDLGLQRALARPDRPSTVALTELARAWRPWRAFAAAHLWLSLAP